MEKFTFDLAVQGRFSKDVWKPAIGEKLHVEQDPDNAVDEFAMKVVKKQREIPCMLAVLSVRFEVGGYLGKALGGG